MANYLFTRKYNKFHIFLTIFDIYIHIFPYILIVIFHIFPYIKVRL